jgi:hypothetical protein
MPEIVRCRSLPPEELRAGRWADAVDVLLSQQPPPRQAETNRAEAAAFEVLRNLEP